MEIGQIKVLHLDTGSQLRGGQQQALRLHQGLLERGIESGFVCLPDTQLQDFLAQHKLPHHAISWRGEFDLQAALKLATYAHHNGFTILHAHTSHAHSWALLAKLLRPGLKLVVTRRVAFEPGANPLSRLKYRIRVLDRIIAVSQDIRQVLLRAGVPDSRIRMIHSGIDTAWYASLQADPAFRTRWQLPADAILVGTAAAFTKEKDYPNFLRAAALALQKAPQLYFMAVGEGPQLARIKELAGQMGLGQRLVFAGFQRDLRQFYAAWDIFVLASKREGLNNAVMEAMSAGLPVIATLVGGMPELIQTGVDGLLVPPDNSEAMAVAIVSLAGDPSLRKELGVSASVKAGDFDQKLMVERNLALYREL